MTAPSLAAVLPSAAPVLRTRDEAVLATAQVLNGIDLDKRGDETGSAA